MVANEAHLNLAGWSGASSLRVLQGWRFSDRSIYTFRVVVESTPAPFEIHKGCGTRVTASSIGELGSPVSPIRSLLSLRALEAVVDILAGVRQGDFAFVGKIHVE